MSQIINRGMLYGPKKWQCQFQVMGRRCPLPGDVCAMRHRISSWYCKFHGREEDPKQCEFSLDLIDEHTRLIIDDYVNRYKKTK